MNFSFILLFICISLAAVAAGRILIHWFQLESYQFPGYFKTVRRNTIKALTPGIILSVFFTAIYYLLKSIFGENNQTPANIVLSFSILAAALAVLKNLKEKKAKKPLAFTPRIKRLHIVSVIILFFIVWGLFQIFSRDTLLSGILLFFFLPLWLALCGFVAWPLEKMINELYFRDAQKILKNSPNLIKIGITGSWGKTSVKFILGSLLNEKYNTLITPASYNTPMGVTKVIRTMLTPGHKIFVAEMGARHVGDIREMCRLVNPEIGILTSVGPQHLDTFKSLDRIIKTKYELIEALPKNGAAFFSDDHGTVRELWGKTDIEKYLTGTDPLSDDVWAENLTVSPEGSRFILCTKKTKVSCRTDLLGELNIKNILLCAAVCLKLGLNEKEIARGIEKLECVEHRLQLIRKPGGITILDDAFNSNIVGAEQAFHVLKDFPGKRIIITPGMVELGNREEELNREFGEKMACSCDFAILVGKKRSNAIQSGLENGGFAKEKILIVNSLDEAAGKLREIVSPGDTVLFENDLPDNYTEG